MANEIQMSARLYAAKGGASIDGTTYTVTANMTGFDMGQQTQDVSTSAEALDITPDVASPYRVMIRNIDTINSVQVGFYDAVIYPNVVYPIRIQPGEFCLLPRVDAGNTIMLKSTAGVVKTVVQMCEL
jgi:hypothetical protein